jgi:HEAT repeat protein
MGFLSFFKRPSVDELEARGDVDGLIKELFARGSKHNWQAAKALAQMGGGSGVDAMLKACIHDDVNIRATGAMTLGFIKDPAAFGRLAEIVKNRSLPNPVRAMACQSLGGIGNKDAVVLLIAMLAEADQSLRVTAAYALGEIGGVEAADALFRKYGDPAVQFASVIALSRLKDARTVPLIREQLPKRREEMEQLELMKALADVGGDEAMRLLCEAPESARKFCGATFGEQSGAAMLTEGMSALKDDALRERLRTVIDSSR